MKQMFFSLAILSAMLLCSSAGCKHDTDDVQPAASGTNTNTNAGTNGNNNTAGSTTNPTSGNWTVSYYLNDGTDMSHHLDGYTFDFKNGGVLSVTTGAATVSGTWRVGNDDSKQKFIITLAAGADHMLAELAEDWTIKTNTAAELDLIKTGGHPREIHFNKK